MKGWRCDGPADDEAMDEYGYPTCAWRGCTEYASDYGSDYCWRHQKRDPKKDELAA